MTGQRLFRGGLKHIKRTPFFTLFFAPLPFTGHSVAIAFQLHVRAMAKKVLCLLAAGHLTAEGATIAGKRRFFRRCRGWGGLLGGICRRNLVGILVQTIESYVPVGKDGDQECAAGQQTGSAAPLARPGFLLQGHAFLSGPFYLGCPFPAVFFDFDHEGELFMQQWPLAILRKGRYMDKNILTTSFGGDKTIFFLLVPSAQGAFGLHRFCCSWEEVAPDGLAKTQRANTWATSPGAFF